MREKCSKRFSENFHRFRHFGQKLSKLALFGLNDKKWRFFAFFFQHHASEFPNFSLEAKSLESKDNRPIPHVRSVKLEHYNATSSLAVSVLGKHVRAKWRANLKNNIVFYLLALQLFALK